MKVLACFCSIFAIVAGAALGHDDLPESPTAMIQDHPMIVTRFKLSMADLLQAEALEWSYAARCALAGQGDGMSEETLADLEPSPFWKYSSPMYTVENCGGVEWNAATRASRQVCHEVSIQTGVWPPAFPIVDWPKSYNEDDHHSSYHFQDGDLDYDGQDVLMGNCVSFVISPPPQPNTPTD